MQYARAIIAAVLATGLVIIITLQEIGDVGDVKLGATEDGLIIDGTFALLVIAIVILTVPDAIAYFKHKKKPEKLDEEDE